MSTLTTNMSLTAWTASDDPYSHVQLAQNWNLVDLHDHSTGKGKRVITDGLADHCVTNVKLAEPAVNTSNYYPNSITSAALADSLLDALMPLGLVQHFWRPSSSSEVVWGAGRASGKLFELCDGRTILAADHDLAIGGSITLPNLIAKFVYGGVAANMSVTGGSSSAGIAHSHTVNSHSHTVTSHAHTVNAHAHGIGADGGFAAHSHTFAGGLSAHTRRNVPITGDGATNPLQFVDVASNVRTFSLQSLYIAGLNAASNGGTYDQAAPMDTASGAAAHSHGSATGDSAPTTTASAPTTDAQAPGTDSALGTVAILPPHLTLVPVVRVRNP